MRFINRKNEFEQLETIHQSRQKELVVIYGRRRLGKTTLLRAYANKYRSLFFSCPISTEKEALRLFQEEMAKTFNEPFLSHMQFPGWSEALAYAFEKSVQLYVTVFLLVLRLLHAALPPFTMHKLRS